MYILSHNRDFIVNHFNAFEMDSFEKRYVLDDCVPYFDSNQYWDNNLPVGLYDEKDNLCGMCFFIVNNYKGLKFLDIKRIFTFSNCRNLGYGTALLNFVRGLFKYSDVKYIRMFCNLESKGFYSKAGYNFHGEIAGGYLFVFQPLLKFDRDDNTLQIEKEYIVQQIEKYNGVIYK